MLIAFCCPRMAWKWLGRSTGGENQEVFLLLRRPDTRQVGCAGCCASDSFIALPSSVLHLSPWPCITASQGPYFLPSFESRRGPVCHHLGKISREMRSSGGRQRLRPPGNAATHKRRFTAPLPFRQFIWCDAEPTAPHFQVLQTPLPPQEPVRAVWGRTHWAPRRAATWRWCWQMGAGSPKAAFQNPLPLTGPRFGTYSIFTTQWYAANTVFCQLRLFFLSFSLWKKSQLCAKRLCVCIPVCILGEKKQFLLIYFPVESLPCSQGNTVFTVYKFG